MTLMDFLWQSSEECNAVTDMINEPINIEKRDICALTLEDLKEEIKLLGEKPFRAVQIYDWLHKKFASGFDEMLNVPLALRKKLEEKFDIFGLDEVRVQESKEDGTRKYLFRLHDGNFVESVLMRYHHGNSVCISSQVGCRMGCSFCASTLGGLVRNLTAGEMLRQIYRITEQTGERVDSVVVMGIGEPLDNFDNLVNFVKILSSKEGLCLSQRNITVSTCGLVPRIKLLADEKLQITLAISLHAVTDEKRRALMPVAKSYSLAELIAACHYYFEKTGRRITLEYSLIAGKNDSKKDAEGLAEIAVDLKAHVNLIPVNPVRERGMEQPLGKIIASFKSQLEKRHANATIRRELGRDIDGACGQLRARELELLQ